VDSDLFLARPGGMEKDVVVMIARAKEVAIQAHGDQMYGGRPYFYHLHAVYLVLKEFGCTDLEILAAAYLHDMLEDTGYDPIKLQIEFGTKITMLVSLVTNMPGKNRKERNARTYPIIRRSQCAVMLKLADRIANVRQAKIDAPRLFDMYVSEYPGFRLALRLPEECNLTAMWTELDHLMEAR
jgi:guanosine-3',5'-bis(diphosphate) 3'-pyrophosphohydrolase